jgi:hypothetical protein
MSWLPLLFWKIFCQRISPDNCALFSAVACRAGANPPYLKRKLSPQPRLHSFYGINGRAGNAAGIA